MFIVNHALMTDYAEYGLHVFIFYKKADAVSVFFFCFKKIMKLIKVIYHEISSKNIFTFNFIRVWSSSIMFYTL